MTAHQIVDRLLESGFGYSEQERPEHWEEVPYGFKATRPGDRRIEGRWDDKAKVYRMTVYWDDPHTGREGKLEGWVQSTRDPEAYLARMKANYEANGWTFELL